VRESLAALLVDKGLVSKEEAAAALKTDPGKVDEIPVPRTA
jgi:hypothetical protein